MRWIRVLAMGFLLVGLLSTSARAQEPGTATVVVLNLDGIVDPLVADYVTKGIEAANDEGAAAIVLTIDTPGGYDSSMRDVIQAVLNSSVPVICYVSPPGARAASAGTFILIGCPVAAMAPGTNVGAAHPVGVSGAILSEKVENDAVAYIRSLAELRGRNADWAEQAVRESVSISAEEALDIDVIDQIAPTTEALLSDANGTTVTVVSGDSVTLDTEGARTKTQGMGLGARIVHSLLTPDFAFILFFLGIALITIELLHPGVSVPGILGLLSLVAAFVSFGALPVQIIGMSLLVASAMFFFLELKHPGLGAPTIGGAITLVLGGLLLFNPSVPNARVSPWVIAGVALVLVGFSATVVQATLRARHLPPAAGLERLIGTNGVVARELDPEGVVQVASETWTATTDIGPVPKGRHVKVVGVEGLRLKVELDEEQEVPAEPGSAEGSAS